jgi:hypothetical protein
LDIGTLISFWCNYHNCPNFREYFSIDNVVQTVFSPGQASYEQLNLRMARNTVPWQKPSRHAISSPVSRFLRSAKTQPRSRSVSLLRQCSGRELRLEATHPLSGSSQADAKISRYRSSWGSLHSPNHFLSPLAVSLAF